MDGSLAGGASPFRRYGIEGPAEPRLRLGLLAADPLRLPRWAVRGVRLLQDSGLVDLVIVAAPEGRGTQPPQRRRNLAFRLARATIWRTPSAQVEPSRGLLAGAELVTVSLDPEGSPRLAHGGLERLREARLDVLLRLGLDEIDDPDGDIATHGIWSYEAGGGMLPSGPVGFWALADRASEVDVRLIQSRGPGRRQVIAHGRLAVEPHSYRGTAERILLASVDLPLLACRDVLAGPRVGSGAANVPEASEPPAIDTGRGLPGWRDVARVMASTVVASLARGLYGAFVLKQWSVGRLAGGAARVLSGDLVGASWVRPTGRTRIMADPSVVPGMAGSVALCEVLDHADGRGRIARLEVIEAPGSRSRAALTVRQEILVDLDGHHLSYPSLAPANGHLLLVPEAAASGGFVLADLTAGAISVADVRHAGRLAAIDPTLFTHAARWWLACTERGPFSGSHLWLFHGPDPRGPWTGHTRNPVLIDAAAARGAGTPFWHEGQLYRPAQDLRAGYGRSLCLMRVLVLTPDDYAEELAIELGPDPDGPFPRGLHTISVDGDAIWLDGYRTVFHPLAGWYRLRAQRARSAAPGRFVGGWPT